MKNWPFPTRFKISSTRVLDGLLDPATGRIELSASANPAAIGRGVTITAVVSPGAGATGIPTGSVQFKVDGATVGPPAPLREVHGAAQAALKTSFGTTGIHTIEASYAAGPNLCGISAARNEVVVNGNPDSSTTALSVSANPATLGESVTFTAVVRPGGRAMAAPTGSVQFMIDEAKVGPPVMLRVVSGLAQSTFSTSRLGVGLHSVVAVYGGDRHFKKSTSIITVVDVGKEPACTRTMRRR